MLEFLKIRNFERFQHYRDRRPPWIKLYKDLWNDPRFFVLSEGERYFLISLFIIASQNDNKIPNNQSWLKREMATSKSIPIARLMETGWVEPWEQDASNHASAPASTDASEPLAECKQVASPRALARDRSTEGEGDIPQPPLLAFGEFGWVRLTPEQHAKLQAKLNGQLHDYFARFDRWVNEAPDAKVNGVKRRDRHAYESILNWHDRDSKEQPQPERYRPKTVAL